MTTYQPFFTLEIAHPYYADGRCPDFQIQAEPETQKRLAGFRLVLKPFPNGIRVMAAVDDQGMPFIPIPQNVLFSFHLKLQNPHFGLFTDLDEIRQLAAPLFTNAQTPAGPDLGLVSRQLGFSEVLVVQNPGPQEPFRLGGSPLDNLKTADFSLSDLGKVNAPKSFDPITRVLKVNSAKADPGTPFTVTYPVQPRLDRDVFADVDIRYPATLAALSGSETIFRISFKPKEARWKYYIVTNKLDNKTSLPSLQDSQNKIVFNPTDRTDLILTPDGSDPIAVKLVEQYPNKQYFRLISSDLIPCQEVARKNIQLLLDGQKVVDVLSNPSLLNFSIDSRSSPNEYTLHQIVEYYPH